MVDRKHLAASCVAQSVMLPAAAARHAAWRAWRRRLRRERKSDFTSVTASARLAYHAAPADVLKLRQRGPQRPPSALHSPQEPHGNAADAYGQRHADQDEANLHGGGQQLVVPRCPSKPFVGVCAKTTYHSRLPPPSLPPLNPRLLDTHYPPSYSPPPRSSAIAARRRTDRQTDRQFGRKTHSEQLGCCATHLGAFTTC